MDIISNNIRAFIEVAEKGSFTEAASSTYSSQPAVSRAIKALEEELNVKLFFRDKRNGLILTDAGQKILLLARQMKDIENRIYQTAFRENNFLGGKIKIGSMPILTSVILSKVFFRFRQKYPNVTIELLEGTSIELRKAVEDHQVDFAFLASPFGDFDSEGLLIDRMVSVSKNEFDSTDPINLYNNTEEYILCHAGYETVIEEMKSKKIKLDNSFTVQQAETVISLVNDGNGIGILSELVLNEVPNSLYRHPITPAVEIDLGIIANDLNDMTPVALVMMSMIRDECNNYQKIHS